MPLIDHLLASTLVRRAIWKFWYPFLTRRLREEEVLFLNYAFAEDPPRALALDPPILFLDEPTAGLDPVSATAFDDMIMMLNRTLGVTIVMITHDLDTLFTVCDRAAVLVDKKIAIDSLRGLLDSPHPWIHEYLHGTRAAGAMVAAEKAAAHGK